MSGPRMTFPVALSLAKRPKDAPPVVHEPELAVGIFPWGFAPGQRSLVAVVKATFALVDGAPADLLAEPETLAGDEPFEEGGSLRRASDFAPYKPRVDVTLIGHAYPNTPRATTAHAALRVGDLRHEVGVVGDRVWDGAAASQPSTFERMPLVWERAFGGPGDDANPVGRGFGQRMLPNLEAMGALARTPSDRPRPACFAPVPREWASRRSGLGTYDARWLAERWPFLPEDVDWSVFNAAPAELQLAAARGDEDYELAGVFPDRPVLVGRLPGVRPRLVALTARDGATTLEEVPLSLDTIAFDADARTVSLVWRGRIAVTTDAAPEIDRFAAVLRPVDDPTPLEARLAEATALLLEREGPGALVANDVAGPGATPPTLPTPAPPRVGRDETLHRLAVADLSGVDLSGCDLRELDLAGRSLRGANLTEARLEGANLRGADLAGAVLTRASAVGANFREANLEAAALAEVALSGANFSGARLDHALLADSDARGACFDDTSLVRARLDDARLEGASFDRATANGAILSGAWADGASFRAAKLDDAQLYDTRAEGARLEGASLVRGRLDGARLARAVFTGACATGASFEESDLASARLDEATLDESVLAHANLAGACLDRATARGARFRGANLAEAFLRRANLAEASLEGALLRGTDLRGANLHGAELLDAVLDRPLLDEARLTNTKLAQR